MTFQGSFVINQKVQANLQLTDFYSVNKNKKFGNASGGTNLKGRSLLSVSNSHTYTFRILVKVYEEFNFFSDINP